MRNRKYSKTVISFRTTILVFILLCKFSSVYSSHVIGGTMWYEWLGNDSLRVNLLDLQSCSESSEYGEFDDLIDKAIFFDSSNQMFEFNYVESMLPPTYHEITQIDSCYLIPQDICVFYKHKYFDFSIDELPSSGFFSHQNCCLTADVTNVSLPLQQGINHNIELSTEAIELENNSPVFNVIPPSYLCYGVDFEFNVSAIDVDSDSLVYSLELPDRGLDDNPEEPPFPNLLFSTGDDPSLQLGMNSEIQIDQNTGVVTGVANRNGLFVIGVSVKEYRNGEILSTAKLILILKVLECEPTRFADFEIIQNCNNDSTLFSVTADPLLDYTIRVNGINYSQDSLVVIEDLWAGQWNVSLTSSINNTCENKINKVFEVSYPCGRIFSNNDTIIQSNGTVFCRGDSLALDVKQCENYIYRWNKNDPIDGEELMIGHHLESTAIESGNYFVTTTDTITGCQWTAEKYIEVVYPCFRPHFFVPNIMLISDDTANTFEVGSSLNLLEYELEIFSRWGDSVFTSTEIGDNWDGYFGYKLVEQDVYTWVIKYSYEFENNIINEFLVGDVTVIR